MKNKNILVTGGAGFIGYRFVQKLLDKNQGFIGNVINFDKLINATNKELIESFLSDERYTFIEGDICEKGRVKAIISAYEIDLIVHFAAETHVDKSIETPKIFVQSNIMGTFSLLEAVRKKRDVHFHQISTDEVFGSCQKHTLFSEKSPYNPQSPYSASKAACDHLVKSYMNTYNISATISYCTNNFGPGQDKEKFLPKMIDGLLNKTPLTIYGRGENIRDWLYVDDHIDALFLILEKKTPRDTYVIGARNQMTNMQVVNCLIDLFLEKEKKPRQDYTSLITFIEDRPGHDFCYGVDPTKIEQELGFFPKTDFRNALKKTIDWYQNLQEAAFSIF